ncbi:basic salivary proline-rich protein 3 [Trichechus manatus latirostris]|uniref:Basic salivary proline-rich protein 3 n=1 Tax=Trichechus manatus latirostris TaxID=127582 RepID=A0A2Y9FWC3_TRIMA|nr:basic salivary proline-rich protein 3 [Trichechus manatus latirostris]
MPLPNRISCSWRQAAALPGSSAETRRPDTQQDIGAAASGPVPEPPLFPGAVIPGRCDLAPRLITSRIHSGDNTEDEPSRPPDLAGVGPPVRPGPSGQPRCSTAGPRVAGAGARRPGMRGRAPRQAGKEALGGPECCGPKVGRGAESGARGRGSGLEAGRPPGGRRLQELGKQRRGEAEGEWGPPLASVTVGWSLPRGCHQGPAYFPPEPAHRRLPAGFYRAATSLPKGPGLTRTVVLRERTDSAPPPRDAQSRQGPPPARAGAGGPAAHEARAFAPGAGR